jgi:cyanophycin synthetase
MEIARQGFTSKSVPPAGFQVLIQRNGNHAFDVTDEVHPATAAAASLAARIVGLDIAGIDLVAGDISRPLEEQGGAIVEVNAGPSLLMHIKPAVGKPRPVGAAIVDHLFPNHDDGRIPVIGISGTYGKTAVAHMVDYLLALSGKHTGLACSNGYYLNRRLVYKGDHANWKAVNRILVNRSIEAAIFENGVDGMLREGLAYDRCQIGVITNVDLPSHFGRHEIETAKQVFDILRTQVDVVLPSGAAVLNAREQILVDMAALCDGEVIYFSSDPDLTAIVEHRSRPPHMGSARGNRAVILRGEEICLVNGSSELPLVRLANIPFINGRVEVQQVENILAAVAVAWAIGMEPDFIRTGIEGFPDINQSPDDKSDDVPRFHAEPEIAVQN